MTFLVVLPTVKGSPRGQWLSICGQDRGWLMLPWRWEVSWRQSSSGWMVEGYESQVGHDFSLEISVKVYLLELSAPYIYIDCMFKRCNICSNIHCTWSWKKEAWLKKFGWKAPKWEIVRLFSWEVFFKIKLCFLTRWQLAFKEKNMLTENEGSENLDIFANFFFCGRLDSNSWLQGCSS